MCEDFKYAQKNTTTTFDVEGKRINEIKMRKVKKKTRKNKCFNFHIRTSLNATS